MKTWAQIGLVFILIVVGAAVMEKAKARPEVKISCSAKGDSGDCKIENNGDAGGDVKADVIFVCRDGEHLAHVEARVEAHNHATKIIYGFSPRVGLLTSCAGIDYRNFSVK